MNWNILEPVKPEYQAKRERLLELHFNTDQDNHTLVVLLMPDGDIHLHGDKRIKIEDMR